MKTADALHLPLTRLFALSAPFVAAVVLMILISSCTYIPTVEEARTAGYTYEDLVKVRSAANQRYHRAKKKSDPQKELQLRAVIAALTRRIDNHEKKLKSERGGTLDIADKRVPAPPAKPMPPQRDPELVRQAEEFMSRGQSSARPTDADIEKLRKDIKETQAALEQHREYYKERTAQP